MRKVIQEYEVVYSNAICLKQGARVKIIRRETNPEWQGWVWCEAEDGQAGWISESYLSIDNNSGRLIRDYNAKEVSVLKGETVKVLKMENGWSWVGKSDGSEGWIPLKNLEQ